MWRLGLDIGSNSIGWAVLSLKEADDGLGCEPCGIVDMGVRIFPMDESLREPMGKRVCPKLGSRWPLPAGWRGGCDGIVIEG